MHAVQSRPLPAYAPAALAEFRALVQARTGVCLSAAKLQAVAQKLSRGTAPDGKRNGLGAALRSGEGWRRVLDMVTTNTTSFFREQHHFALLGHEIARNRAMGALPGRAPLLKVWSAAASEGDEAWSAAIALAEAQRRGLALDYAILATDITPRVLAVARQAVYDGNRISAVPDDLRRRYLMASATQPRRWRVVPELRARVRFAELNLAEASYPVDQDVDVIFLRNVLIYFDDDTKRAVISRLVGHLAPGGWLLVGHAESMSVRHARLHQVRPTVFRKVAA